MTASDPFTKPGDWRPTLRGGAPAQRGNLRREVCAEIRMAWVWAQRVLKKLNKVTERGRVRHLFLVEPA